ncbi:hypothetical protein RAZWK3B_12412 [Roseobacter sp. AzwK-3b]|uniref:hypothetical protein n=1 Tax=Roseobacter sp. AzwK-3b TaxID=351016 RepID=UPI0001569E97|nr:hypothetical protein [Roseobacter sp. AzwK-3b]EDM69453.1 hypothetical protein RAZWK3B_12412 [Roseobacter sp. AzwK-3b]
MSDLIDQSLKLKREILESDPDKRLGYEAPLGKLIASMQEQDIPVPAEIRDLHEELVNEMIESQFDNMPV